VQVGKQTGKKSISPFNLIFRVAKKKPNKKKKSLHRASWLQVDTGFSVLFLQIYCDPSYNCKMIRHSLLTIVWSLKLAKPKLS